MRPICRRGSRATFRQIVTESTWRDSKVAQGFAGRPRQNRPSHRISTARRAAGRGARDPGPDRANSSQARSEHWYMAPDVAARALRRGLPVDLKLTHRRWAIAADDLAGCTTSSRPGFRGRSGERGRHGGGRAAAHSSDPWEGLRRNGSPFAICGSRAPGRSDREPADRFVRAGIEVSSAAKIRSEPPKGHRSAGPPGSCVEWPCCS